MALPGVAGVRAGVCADRSRKRAVGAWGRYRWRASRRGWWRGARVSGAVAAPKSRPTYSAVLHAAFALEWHAPWTLHDHNSSRACGLLRPSSLSLCPMRALHLQGRGYTVAGMARGSAGAEARSAPGRPSPGPPPPQMNAQAWAAGSGAGAGGAQDGRLAAGRDQARERSSACGWCPSRASKLRRLDKKPVDMVLPLAQVGPQADGAAALAEARARAARAAEARAAGVALDGRVPLPGTPIVVSDSFVVLTSLKSPLRVLLTRDSFLPLTPRRRLVGQVSFPHRLNMEAQRQHRHHSRCSRAQGMAPALWPAHPASEPLWRWDSRKPRRKVLSLLQTVT